MAMLERIKATLYCAEQREITDCSVKLWLKELKRVAYDAEDVLDEYRYEILRAQVEARNASPPNSLKRNQFQLPDGMCGQIKQIKGRFDEICKDRIALRLSEEDGPRRYSNEFKIAQTSHLVDASNIFGRKREKEELVHLLSSECHDGKIISVVTILGTGGIGKTTLAQLVYNDQRIRQRFDKFGWVCVSEDFNIQRLTRELIESITGRKCDLTNLSALQEQIKGEVSGKRILLVLDDVWNEKRSHWESFQVPFRFAEVVKILVTTRNEPVARIMQTVPTFNLGYLSEEQCWRLFQRYALGDIKQNQDLELVEIGKQIMKKCGMLPLAVKSIASLLRHEPEEKSWREILQSELWESDASNDIFPPLQISYARLPTYLKPCFLICSMFPKDHRYYVEDLVKLWIYQGYVESDGKKNRRKISEEYAKQLRERSFFEKVYEDWGVFKLHDMVHDLARFNSENECYSIMEGNVLDFPKELYHLYVHNYVDLVEPLPLGKFSSLRTLILGYGVEKSFSQFDFSKTQKLRALELRSQLSELEVLSSAVNFRYLRYLSIENLHHERLPECVCSLYSLQNLTLIKCHDLRELPKSIGDLVSLEELVIDNCPNLTALPPSLCQIKALTQLCLLQCTQLEELPNDIGSLTNLQTLQISFPNRFNSLPTSLSKFIGIQTLEVQLECKTIKWLKDLVDLEGTLRLRGLNNMPSLTDVQCANLASMHKLECLELWWVGGFGGYNNGFSLLIKSHQNAFLDEQNDFLLMDRLQPHHNLRKLYIAHYSGVTFPKWIGNPTSCASLEKIVIDSCENLTFLPFGSLCKLKYLMVLSCSRLRFLPAESLPMQLQELEIRCCRALISAPGIQKMKSLVKLCIMSCGELHFLVTDAELSIEPTIRANVSSYQNTLSGLRNLTSLRNLHIAFCPKLHLPADDLFPLEFCKVKVYNCAGLKEWCLQHNITYKDDSEFESESESESEAESTWFGADDWKHST